MNWHSGLISCLHLQVPRRLQDYFREPLGRLDLAAFCTEADKLPLNCITMSIEDSTTRICYICKSFFLHKLIGNTFIITVSYGCPIIGYLVKTHDGNITIENKIDCALKGVYSI